MEGPDPAKETRTVITASGAKFEVPTVVTGGYDLDALTCTFCNNRVFKNDKTLMGHMLNHFGVTPKMANCPICGLTLQKKRRTGQKPIGLVASSTGLARR